MWKLDTSHGYHKDCAEGLSEKQYLIFQCIFFHKDETHMKQIGACIKRHTAWTKYLSDGLKTMQKNNYMLLSSIFLLLNGMKLVYWCWIFLFFHTDLEWWWCEADERCVQAHFSHELLIERIYQCMLHVACC